MAAKGLGIRKGAWSTGGEGGGAGRCFVGVSNEEVRGTHSFLRVFHTGSRSIPHGPGHPVTGTSPVSQVSSSQGLTCTPHPGKQLPASHHPLAGAPAHARRALMPWHSACTWLSSPPS